MRDEWATKSRELGHYLMLVSISRCGLYAPRLKSVQRVFELERHSVQKVLLGHRVQPPPCKNVLGVQQRCSGPSTGGTKV